MNSFKTNKIFFDSETVAEQLRSARQKKELKLEKIAKELNINIRYLNALERGNFELLPAGVYGKNFLREYALFLNLDYRPLLKMYDNEIVDIQQKEKRELFSAQVVRSHYFLTIPKIIKNLIILIVVTICLVYLSFRLQQIVAPPKLIIDKPVDYLTTKEHSIVISGNTENETELKINEEPVIIDTNGSFSKLVDLKMGINVFTITAQKKYGRTITIKKQILVEN